MQNAAQRANMYGQQGFGSQISGRSTDGKRNNKFSNHMEVKLIVTIIFVSRLKDQAHSFSSTEHPITFSFKSLLLKLPA